MSYIAKAEPSRRKELCVAIHHPGSSDPPQWSANVFVTMLHRYTRMSIRSQPPTPPFRGLLVSCIYLCHECGLAITLEVAHMLKSAHLLILQIDLRSRSCVATVRHYRRSVQLVLSRPRRCICTLFIAHLCSDGYVRQ